MTTNDLLGELVKGAGSLGGTILALIFQPPKTTPEFYARAAFSLISGYLFGGSVREYLLKWPETTGSNLAVFGIVALASWWLWAMAVRIMSVWKPKE